MLKPKALLSRSHVKFLCAAGLLLGPVAVLPGPLQVKLNAKYPPEDVQPPVLLAATQQTLPNSSRK